MIFEEIKNIKSGKKELRNFGFVIGAVLVLIALYQIYNSIDLYIYFLSSGFAFAAFGLALPEVLKPLQVVWMAIAVVLGFIMTRVILSILFYLIITPMSFLASLFGKDFLELKLGKKDSYWNKRELKDYEKITTERQF